MPNSFSCEPAMPDCQQRYGVFLNVENPHGNARDALLQTVDHAIVAEALGYHDVWVAEHHYSSFAIGSALMVLLAQIAARTSRIRLGTGASLLALNDPLRVAEDVATLDLLSNGRMEFGVARGGPFPEQYRHAGLSSADLARARMIEALDVTLGAWQGVPFSIEGRFFHYDRVQLQPQPLQRPIPVWLASMSEDALDLAARRGYGLMATPSADLGQVVTRVAAQRAQRGPFPFAVARFFHCEPEAHKALAHGLAGVRAYPRMMQVQFAPGGTPPMFQADASDQVILANAIIGDPAQCVARIGQLQEKLGPHRLLLKPASHDPQQARAALSLLAGALGLQPSAST